MPTENNTPAPAGLAGLCVKPPSGPLTEQERQDLEGCELVIERGKKSFLEVGGALAEVRERRLYREAFDTFEDYCVERWGFQRAHAYRLIEASEVAGRLSPIGDTPAPANEAQVRELAKVPAEMQAEVWQVAAARNGGKAPPASLVAEVGAEVILARFTPQAIALAHKQKRAERETERRAERLERLEAIAKGNRPLGFDTMFPVILADPPWRYDFAPSESQAIERHYPTMDLEAIAALPVGELATEDAVLFLWYPPGKATEAVEIVRAWGFTERAGMVWIKPSIGPGYWARMRHEPVMIAVRGNMPTPAAEVRRDSVIEARRGRHSQKPDALAEYIEAAYPALPKLELFSRSPRPGWTAWGNQAHGEGGAA